MPTYEYRCKDCGHQFDVAQSFSDDSLTVCPSCGGALRKLFGSVGITFKGSGFYKTDNRVTASSSNGDGGDTSSDKQADKVSASKDGATKTDSSAKGGADGNGSTGGKPTSSSAANDRAKPKKDGGGGRGKDGARSGTGAKSSSRSDAGS